MSSEFTKFPRTPHLAWIGKGTPRGDKLLVREQAEELLREPCAVEEKIDGAGIGFSVSESGVLLAQNRGHFLSPGTGAPQFRSLWRWMAAHDGLRQRLGRELILFGEWCYARHSVGYDKLPDWFVAFDVYDRVAQRFWSRARRDVLCQALAVCVVPILAEGRFTLPDLIKLMGTSRMGSEPMEGVYLRWDAGEYLTARAKLVRMGWVQVGEEHWSRKALVENRLDENARTFTSASI